MVLDLSLWRAATPGELIAFLEGKRRTAKPQRPPPPYLVVRDKLRPVDVYAYLRARFGQPNGIQNILRRDDSDNWIHWDFYLKAGEADIYVQGASRETHFMVSTPMRPADWRDLVVGLQQDFARFGRAKSEMTRSFEKFVVFQNKYVALADICAGLHARIVDAPPFKPLRLPASRRDRKPPARGVTKADGRATELYGACTQLALLTPVMAEAFLHMFILTLRGPGLRDDVEAYRAYIREPIPDRIGRLHEVCLGMSPVNRHSALYGRFMTVMNKRNFAIHGNVDPEREAMETVYFEGKRPLFAETGHHIAEHFRRLEELYRPETVLADYEDVHGFLHELTEGLDASRRAFFDQVITDAYPGYEVRKKGVTRILPDHLVMAQTGGVQYDDQLKVDWSVPPHPKRMPVR